MISLPFIALVWVGQAEVFSLLGTMIAYRAVARRNEWWLALGVLLMLIKPQETWVIILLIGAAMARQWQPAQCLKTALLAGGAALIVRCCSASVGSSAS